MRINLIRDCQDFIKIVKNKHRNVPSLKNKFK